MSRPQRRWTAEEDSNLQREVEAQMAANDGSVHDWNSIAQKIHGRSNKDCRKRFYNGMVDGLRKGPWTSEEDQMLLSLVNTHGAAWAVVAPEIGTRSADHLNRSPWTPQEVSQLKQSLFGPTDDGQQNMQLLIAVRTHGTAWKDIQTLHLPSRSANNVKNQFSVLKKQTIEVPPNAPVCCAAISSSSKAESSRTANHKTGIQEDGEDFLKQFNEDNISNTDTIYPRSNDADELYSFSSLHSTVPLHSFEKDILPNDTGLNLFDQDFVFDNLDFGSAIEPTNQYDLDSNYDMQLDDAIINQPPYTSNTQPPPSNSTSHIIANQNNDMNDKKQTLAQRPPAHQSHHHRPSGTQWPPAFLDTNASPRKPGPHRQQQQTQQQETPAPTPTQTSSNPPTPNWQTTIRFSEADPTTVSSVIGVLANSQAKFIYETG
ncbi:MAG: hypothetical protein Q9180_003275 [Flavoplaca navasiana]